jgi:glutamyl-tRNA synthetase
MERYLVLARPWLAKAGITAPDQELIPILALVKEKVKFLTELPEWIGFFFNDEFPYLPEAEEKLRKPGALDRLAQLAESLSSLTTWDAGSLEAKLKEVAAAQGVKAAEFVHPARTAVSGKTVGPSLYHMLEELGRERTFSRFQRAAKQFTPKV